MVITIGRRFYLRTRGKINAEFWDWRRNSAKKREALILVVLRRRAMPAELMRPFSKPGVIFSRGLSIAFLMAFIGTPSPRINNSSNAEIEHSRSNELSKDDKNILKQFGERTEQYFRELEIWVTIPAPGLAYMAWHEHRICT